MLFHSSLRRELAASFGATLLVLITIVITMLLIRTLGLANRGSVDPQEILQVLTYTVLGRMPTVLTIALFVSVVFTLSRLYRESEMVIWFSSGRGLLSFLGPILRFAWPILFVIVLLILFVWPWSNRQTEELKGRYEQRSDLQRVVAGQFQESANGRRVFFIDKHSGLESEGHNVFISNVDEQGNRSVTSARSGRIETIDGGQYLVLENGQKVETLLGPAGETTRISHFQRHAWLIGHEDPNTAGIDRLKTMETVELVRQGGPAEMAELAWRVGMIVTALNFILMALALSFSQPRSGRSGNLLFMLFAFVIYYNLLNVGQRWVAAGVMGFWAQLLLLHGSVLLLNLLWLLKRHWQLDAKTLWQYLSRTGMAA